MSYRFHRHFTLEEANTLLPAVREAFRQIHQLVHTKTPADPGISTPEDLALGDCQPSIGNGHDGNGRSHVVHQNAQLSGLSFQQRASTVKEMLVSLQRFGIVVQDVMRGLIDFPCLYQGREVFLCYELSDGDEIRFYHELEDGYPGRHPITDDFRSPQG